MYSAVHTEARMRYNTRDPSNQVIILDKLYSLMMIIFQDSSSLFKKDNK